MEYYALTRNGSLVAVTLEAPFTWGLPDVSAHKFNGKIPDLNTHNWDQETETFVLSSRVLTRFEFLSLFTTQERIAIRGSSDPVVNDFMKLLDVAQEVNRDNQSTIDGINYLVSVNLLTQQRATEILG